MKVAIHQPDYIPYLGYFYKMYLSNCFVFLDDSQFQKNYLNNRNKIKTPQGWCWLTIPVEKNNGLNTNINETRTKDELNWKEKHLKTIEMNYKKSPYFNQIFPYLKKIIKADYETLADMNISIIMFIALNFGILPEKMYKSSEFKLKSKKEEKVLDIIKLVKGDEYISGNGAKDYQKEEDFTSNGIKLTYTDYKPIKYNQQWGDFEENMSVLDFIFNEGFNFDKVIELVKEENKTKEKILKWEK